MKKIRSYTSIWSVEKVLYSINDLTLPFPISFTQMTWFVLALFLMILLGDVFPLSLMDGVFLKYLGIPFACTWFMSQKTFDGKRPYSFLKTMMTYTFRPKRTFAGKPIKLSQRRFTAPITIVRSGTLDELSN